MSKLTSMKLTKADRRKRNEVSPSAITDDGPAYPWGLTLNLDETILAKLKLEALPKAGTTMLIEARVQVESVSVRDDAGGGEQRSLSLQITDLCLEADTDRGSAADRLYKAKG